MKQHHVTSALRQRVFKFFEYSWLRNKGTDRQDMLSDLPYCMQAEISLDIAETMLRSVSGMWGGLGLLDNEPIKPP